MEESESITFYNNLIQGFSKFSAVVLSYVI
jgi:hypothetical protein